MHNSKVDYSDGLPVKRHVKGKKGRVEIDGPKAQAEYVKYFNAADRNDRDSAGYLTSIRTNRYYIRIICWVLDRVVHTCFAVAIYCAGMVVINADWKCYNKSKNNGRRDFQIELGIDILNYGIGLGRR